MLDYDARICHITLDFPFSFLLETYVDVLHPKQNEDDRVVVYMRIIPIRGAAVAI